MQVSPILFTQFNQNKTVQPSFRGRYQAISNEPQSDYYDRSKSNVSFGMGTPMPPSLLRRSGNSDWGATEVSLKPKNSMLPQQSKQEGLSAPKVQLEKEAEKNSKG